MKKVLVSNIMMLQEMERFDGEIRKLGYEPVFPKVNQFLTEDEILAMDWDYEGWLAGDDQITDNVLNKVSDKLKVIAKWGTGIDSIDLNAAKSLGIPVMNSPGAFRDAVSEIAISYMLSLSRYTSYVDKEVRNGNWPKPCGTGLTNKSVGIIGFGAIGRGVAERAMGMKMSVFAYDPYIKGPDSEFPNVEFVSKDELLQWSNFVCLCCNLSDDSFHLIDKQALQLMKSDAYLINVSRGPLVDEQALIQALQSGSIGGAGLDVFEEEPLPSSNELRAMDNVVLGSHNANNLESATEYVHQNTLKNLHSILKDTK